jgi:hypothetical protein
MAHHRRLPRQGGREPEEGDGLIKIAGSMSRRKTNDAKQAAYEKKIAGLRARYLEKHNSNRMRASQKAKREAWLRIEKRVPHLISILPTRSHEDLLGIYRNCINRMSGWKRAETSLPILELHKAVLEEWERRTESLLKDEGYFEWPTTEVANGDGSLSSDAWHSIGMLSVLGYRVGTTEGLPEIQRHFVLDQAFCISLPPLNGPAYMTEWAAPVTASRLKKLAETLAALTRNAKRRRSRDLQVACEEWEADLAFLYRKYYVRRFRFAWPVV